MSKKRIAVLFGGVSSEHEVSRMSVANILRSIPEDRYETVRLGITRDGRWYLYNGSIEGILDGSWETHPDNQAAFLSPDASIHGIVILGDGRFETLRVDCVFPVLHGKNGEDGTVQGLLQLAGIPFVGCDCTASAACMDKVVTNMMLQQAGIPQARFTWLYASAFEQSPEACVARVEREMENYPLFVKPANAGSSVGVSKACDSGQLQTAIRKAAREDRKVLIEEAITGQEVECAVLGNDRPMASIVGEIAPSSDFYDYDDKYINGTSGLYIPAHIPEQTAQALRERAVQAYRLMGCTGLARVDFFVRAHDGAVLLNELNTMPGFTGISMYPKLMEATGIPAAELVDRLIQLAFERAEQA